MAVNVAAERRREECFCWRQSLDVVTASQGGELATQGLSDTQTVLAFRIVFAYICETFLGHSCRAIISSGYSILVTRSVSQQTAFHLPLTQHHVEGAIFRPNRFSLALKGPWDVGS